MNLFEKHDNLLSKIRVGNKYIGEGEPAFFIAEIGCNHNGDYYLAKRMIEEAVKAGADAIKLQKRFIGETVAKELLDKPQTKDQIFGKTYGEYRRKLELNEEEYVGLKKMCDDLGVVFFATPFDKKSVDFLESIGIGIYKIASQDITHLPLLEYVARKGKPIILSIGASTWEESDEAIDIILKCNKQLIIQYCLAIHPTPDEKVSMSLFPLIKERYKPLALGYSGHENNILPSLVAVALGAHSIERHFTLNKSLPGPDHSTISLEPEEFKTMVENARRIEKIRGEPIKKIWDEETKFLQKHGKSVVSTIDIPAGTIITSEMLTCKSPGYGLKPKMIPQLVGKKAKVQIPADTVIIADFIEWQ